MLYTDRVEMTLESLRRDIATMRKLSSGERLEVALKGLETHLSAFLAACEASMMDHEEKEQSAKELFDLRHRQLVGISEEITVLARKKPEQACKAFKAEQVNLVLEPLKKEMEEDLNMTLCLVPEDGSLSYSDVSLLLRNYLDLSAVYGYRHYNLKYYERVS